MSGEEVLVQDVDYSSVNLKVNRKVVKGRSGYVPASTRYDSKNIRATGKIKVSSLSDFHSLKDRLNGMLVDAEPYYITPLLPLNKDLYEYEEPGQSKGDLDLQGDSHSLGYRFKVISEKGLNTNFIGRYGNNLLFSFSIDFITAELPFGETIPKDLDISTKRFIYNGTATNSQLEYPWQLKLTASEAQSGKFTIDLDGRFYDYNSDVQIISGDVFLIGAIETTKNEINVTQYTNYQYFELKPLYGEVNTLTTNFKGQIEIVNYVEFYK